MQKATSQEIKNWLDKQYPIEPNNTIGFHLTYNYKMVKEFFK
jgi:hypothetical protein